MRRALSLSAALLALAATAAPRASATCATNVTANPGGLQTMINAVPTIIGGDYCINLNAGLYNEKITIPSMSFGDNTSRLVLQPAGAGGVEISSDNATISVIDVGSDSVTISGIYVAANGPTDSAINGLGAYLTLNNVVVIDTMSWLATAGVQVAGPWATITNSSFTAGASAYGLYVANTSHGTSISLSTAVAQGSPAMEIDASSVTVSNSYAISVGTGNALSVQSSPNTLWVMNSTFTAGSGIAGLLNTAAGVVLTSDYFQSTSNDALHIVNAGSNSVFNSTMTTAGAGFSALYLNTSGNFVTASNLYHTNASGAALDVDGGGNNNTFSNLVIQSNTDGVQFNGGASNNSFSASTVTANGGRALAVVNGANEQIATSVLWSSGLNNAVEIDAGGGGVMISFSSITTSSGGSNRALYISQPGNTVSDSFLSSNFGSAIMIDNVSGNTIQRSTMTSDTNAEGSLYIANNATSNTISQSSMFNGRGDALRMDGTAGNNTVSQSTIASNGAASGSAVDLLTNSNNNTISGSVILGRSATAPAVLFQNRAASNTITTSFITSVSSGAVFINDGPHNNTISFSTVAASVAGSAAVYVYASSQNALSNDYLADPNGDGLLMVGANYNQVSNSTMYSNTGATYAALRVLASSSNTVTGSFMIAPSGSPAWLGGGPGFNTISQSTFTTSFAGAAALALANPSIGNVFSQCYFGSYGANGYGFFFNGGVAYTQISQSTIAVAGISGAGAQVGVAHSTFTQLVVQAPNAAGFVFANPATDDMLSNSLIQASTGVVVQGMTAISMVGDAITGTMAGATGVSLQAAASVTISGSTVTASGAKGLAVSDVTGSGNSVVGSLVGAPQGVGVLASGSAGLLVSGTSVTGSTGAWVDSSSSAQFSASSVTAAGWAALSVTNAPAGSLVTVSGSTLAANSPATIAVSFNGAASAALDLTGVVDVHGWADIVAGQLQSSANWTLFGGDVTLGSGVTTSVTASTYSFAGANQVPTVMAQTFDVQATAAPSFDSLDVNVASLTVRGQPFNANRFQDLLAGSTVALTANTPTPYHLTTLALRGGTGVGGLVNARSLTPLQQAGVYITDLSGSTVTLAQLTDFFQEFSTISANDGTSVDGGDNSRWNFQPFLDIEAPGETWTEGFGKTGAASNDAAGTVSVTVRATSSGNTTVTGSSIPVTLWGSDVYDSTMTQSLVNGLATFSLPLRRAEPSPFTHVLTAVSTGAYNALPYVYTDNAPVIPGALSSLQLVTNGEFADPGSTTTGKFGAPAPVVPGGAMLATIRGVDAFWNKVPSASDSVMLSTTGANLPQTQSLIGGATNFSFIVFAATAASRDLVAMDLSNGAITASTSTPFQIFPISVTSPTVSINISSPSVQTTLGGGISGTASDPSAVTQVSVAVERLNDNQFYDWTANIPAGGDFRLAAPQYATATLTSPNAASTNWSISFPDSQLWSNTSYYVLVRSSDPSNNVATNVTVFTFNPNFGQVGSPGDGEGTAVVTFEDLGGSPTSVGCGVVAASMTFTTGAHGINAGGQIAVHVPDNWTGMNNSGPFSPASNPAAVPGGLVVGSTAAFALNLSPTSQSSATFGNNWFLYTAQAPLGPGQRVYFTMTSFTGNGPQSVGPQRFTVLTQGDGVTGLFKPIAAQPSATLRPGPPSTLQFSNQQVLTLGPLQTSATMQLNVFDACGNSTNTATNTTAFINGINSAGADPGAQFYLAGGAPVVQNQLTIPGNASASPGFYFVTSTPGPYYEQLTSSAVFFGGAFTWATRYAQVLSSTVGLSGVSVDTGTLLPGVAVATMTPGSFSGAAVVNFTLSNPNVPWEVIISTDGTNFTPELVHRNGVGQPGRTVSWTGLTETSYPQTLVAPGGPYYVKIRAGGGVVEDDSLRVYVATTASVYGTVNSTGAYAYVNAQGPNTNFANFAVADQTGHFQIYGLQNGGHYNIVATTGAVVNGQFLQLQSSSFNVTAVTGGSDVGAMPFPTPTFLRVRVQIPQPAPFEFWGGFNAFSTTGQQAWGTLHYLPGADKSDSGATSFGGSASTWTIVGVTPGTYNLQINLPQVSVSSSLPNFVIPPGTTTDLFIALQRKANVYGWAVVPSSTQYGTWVSVQATKAGDPRPTVFGGAFMQGWQYGVAQTSAVYSLFGLDPGSWTVTARGQGFGSASSSIFISSTADVGDPVNGGVDLTLTSGTVLNGLLQIVGDSSNLPNTVNGGVNVFVNAFNPQTYSNGFAQVFITTSTTLARSTFSITGLDPGTYFLNTWVQGTQAPQLSTTVVSTNSFTTMDLVVDSAKAAVTVWLPGPTPDFHKVGLFYTASSTQPALIQDFGALPGLQVYGASATWVTPTLSPGFLTVTGQYSNAGTFAQGSAQLADGQTTPVTLDLRGSTFTVSGTVVIGGNVNLNINGTAVSVSSVPGVLAQSTTNEYCLSGFTDSITTPTFHLELLPISRQGNYLTQPLVNPAVRNLGPGGGACAHPQGGFFTGSQGDVDPYLAYIINISTDGTFSLPGVPPGGYLLRVPTNLDSVNGFGPDELPPVRQLVRVTTSNVTGLTFTISQGVSISGLVRMPAGLLGSRGMQVSLNDALGNAVRTAFVNFNNSNTTPYFMDRVPDGTYALVVQDFQFPQAFGASPITIKVSGASLNQDIQLQQTGIIKGKLAVQQFLANSTTAQFTVIDAHNANQLPKSFHIYAEANPWIQGGHRDADASCGGGGDATAPAAGAGCGGQGQPSFDQNGEFSISGVLPGLYDVHFESQNDPLDASTIKLSRSLAPGISVNGGGTTDIGTYNLTSAVTLRGTVTDASTGRPIANMPMIAEASLSQNHEVDTPQATTDSSGTYQLVGLDPSVKIYDIYANKRDDAGASPPPYELKVSPSVDVTSITVVNFTMTPAPYSVSGQILGTPGGPGLQIPFGSNGGGAQVGATVFLNKFGVQPHDNPIADLMVNTDPQGRFSIPSLTTGTYKLTAVSQGYASFSENVAITSGSVSLAPITLGLGATLTGALRKPDGSNPSQNEIDTLVAVTNNFSQILVGQLTPDANAKTYTNYTVSGFQPGLSYRVLIFPSGGNSSPMAPAEASNVIFSTTTETRTLDLVLRPAAPYVFSKSRRAGSAFALRFELSQPLRSRQASDNDLTAILSTFSAAGTLSGWDLDSSRSILTALYTPGVGESSFTVRLHGYSTQTNPDSLDPVNPQFVYDSTYTFFLGIDGYYANVMSNMNGGTLAIDDDPGRVAIGGGSFQVDASSSVPIALAIAQEPLSAAPSLQAAGLAPVAANIKALRFGGSSYPSDVFRAMAATPPGVSPFSAFYNVLLPLGLRTSLQKPVPLTINYSTGTDPTTLNLYWYNAAANAYVLQQDVTGAKPVIDTVNHTVTINVNHFSTFVLFNAGVAVISGNAFGGEFTAYNFPNPFDLSTKLITTIHGGGANVSVRGTMISIGLPPDISGDGDIKIYDVAGERVRTISLGAVNGGQYYYQPWDGRNDSGRDVASGVYIGQVKVGDHSKFFKMALIK